MSWNIVPSSTPTFKFLRTLKYRNTLTDDEEMRIPQFLEDTPMLEHVGIRTVRLSAPVPKSWKNLAVLKLHDCFATAVELIELLCFTSNLVDLDMNVTLPMDLVDRLTPIPTVSKCATLLHLDKVKLNFECLWRAEIGAPRNPLLMAMPHIRFPNLFTLTIAAPSTEDDSMDAVLNSIISSGNPSSIHSITFENLAEEDITHVIMSFVAKLPRLESLSIDGNEFVGLMNGNAIHNALQWPAQTGKESIEHPEAEEKKVALCPQLNSIRLSGWIMDSRLFHHTITNRSANSALRNVSVQNLELTEDGFPSGDLGWLHTMVRAGSLDCAEVIPGRDPATLDPHVRERHGSV